MCIKIYFYIVHKTGSEKILRYNEVQNNIQVLYLNLLNIVNRIAFDLKYTLLHIRLK